MDFNVQKKHSTGQKGSKKRTKTFLGQICYKFRTWNIQDSTQISQDIKETALIQGNIDENVFLQYYEKLWKTRDNNGLQLEYNSTGYLHLFINLDELEKVLKLTKMVKPRDKITLTQSYTSMHQKSLNWGYYTF